MATVTVWAGGEIARGVQKRESCSSSCRPERILTRYTVPPDTPIPLHANHLHLPRPPHPRPLPIPPLGPHSQPKTRPRRPPRSLCPRRRRHRKSLLANPMSQRPPSHPQRRSHRCPLRFISPRNRETARERTMAALHTPHGLRQQARRLDGRHGG